MRAVIPTLGHALLDRQHRRIAALSRRLLAVLARDRGRAELSELMRATRRHFATEDRLMTASAYPDRAGHLDLHDGVYADMQRMRVHLGARLPLHRKHVEQILDWLAHHTDEADRNLVAFLAARRG